MQVKTSILPVILPFIIRINLVQLTRVGHQMFNRREARIIYIKKCTLARDKGISAALRTRQCYKRKMENKDNYIFSIRLSVWILCPRERHFRRSRDHFIQILQGKSNKKIFVFDVDFSHSINVPEVALLDSGAKISTMLI